MDTLCVKVMLAIDRDLQEISGSEILTVRYEIIRIYLQQMYVMYVCMITDKYAFILGITHSK